MSRRLVYGFERRVAPHRLAAVRSFTIHDGLVVHGRLSDIIGRSLYLYGTFEYASIEAFRQLVQPEDVVVDAGAHVGTYSLLASRIVGPAGRVLAFEPEQNNLALLRKSVAENNAANVSVHDVALYDRTVDLPLEAALWEHNSGLPRLKQDGARDGSCPLVRCRALDDVLAEQGIARTHVMKVDVEGSEHAVFRGAQETLRAWRPDILFEAGDVEETARGLSNAAIDFLRSLGYDIFGVRLVRGKPHLEPMPEGAWTRADFEIYREPWHQLNLVARHPRSSR